MTARERLAYVPGFVDAYSTEIAAIERAGERLAERIERCPSGAGRVAVTGFDSR